MGNKSSQNEYYGPFFENLKGYVETHTEDIYNQQGTKNLGKVNLPVIEDDWEPIDEKDYLEKARIIGQYDYEFASKVWRDVTNKNTLPLDAEFLSEKFYKVPYPHNDPAWGYDPDEYAAVIQHPSTPLFDGSYYKEGGNPGHLPKGGSFYFYFRNRHIIKRRSVYLETYPDGVRFRVQQVYWNEFFYFFRMWAWGVAIVPLYKAVTSFPRPIINKMKLLAKLYSVPPTNTRAYIIWNIKQRIRLYKTRPILRYAIRRSLKKSRRGFRKFFYSGFWYGLYLTMVDFVLDEHWGAINRPLYFMPPVAIFFAVRYSRRKGSRSRRAPGIRFLKRITLYTIWSLLIAGGAYSITDIWSEPHDPVKREKENQARKLENLQNKIYEAEERGLDPLSLISEEEMID